MDGLLNLIQMNIKSHIYNMNIAGEVLKNRSLFL